MRCLLPTRDLCYVFCVSRVRPISRQSILSLVIRSAAFRAFSWVFSRLFGTRVARAIWHVPGSRAVYRLLITRLRPEHATVRGHALHLDALDSLLLSVNGTYEDDELNIFRGCIRPGDTIIDVGAHIGLYTLEAARATGPTGQVFAFEPSSTNYGLLVENIEANGYSNVCAIEAAVSDHEGDMLLALSIDNTGDHQITMSSTGETPTESIRAVTLDGFLGKDRAVDVIKIDVQGAEPVALTGALATIRANDDLILFTELSPRHLAKWGGTRQYLTTLTAAGFDLRQLAGNKVVSRTSAELDRSHVGADTEHTDLVCVKGVAARNQLERAISLGPTPKANE